MQRKKEQLLPATETADQQDLNRPTASFLIGSCHQNILGYCCRCMFDIPIPRAHPRSEKVILSRGVGALGVALVCPERVSKGLLEELGCNDQWWQK
jgi:hypothetical protein